MHPHRLLKNIPLHLLVAAVVVPDGPSASRWVVPYHDAPADPVAELLSHGVIDVGLVLFKLRRAARSGGWRPRARLALVGTAAVAAIAAGCVPSSCAGGAAFPAPPPSGK